METYERRFTNPILTWGSGLILGILIGLIVLGWWLWPVQWVDASPEDMLYDYQVDYLRTVIQAYGYDPNLAVSKARYLALGDNAETAMAEIVQNPGSLPPELVAEFSVVVAGVPVEDLATQPIETPKTTTGINPWLAVILALLLILIGAFITYLILRGRDLGQGEELVEPLEAAPGEESLEAGYSGSELEPVQAEVEYVEQASQETDQEPEMPDEWYPAPIEGEAELQEQESGGMDLPPFIAAAAGAGAAAMAVDALTGEPSTAEVEADETIELEEAEAAPLEEEEGAEEESMLAESGSAAAGVLAGLAAAEFIEDEGEQEISDEDMTAVEAEVEAPDFDEQVGEMEEVASEVEEESEEPSDSEEPIQPHEPIDVKMRKPLDYVEGIGDVYKEKLGEVGITTTGKLMVEAVSRKGRKDLAQKSGVSETLILKWVNHIDLYRIKGIGSEYADLLEASGVDTVPELAQRNPVNLYQALVETNQEKHLVRQLPVLDQVMDWVEQAKQLPRIIEY